MLLAIITNNINAQQNKTDSLKTPKIRTVSINITPLLITLSPFNKSNATIIGPYNVAFKFGRKNKAFRIGMGAELNEAREESRLSFRIGYEKQINLSKKWMYYLGTDLIFFNGGLNTPNNSGNIANGVGVAPLWGIEYKIQENITLSTETALFIGMVEKTELLSPQIGFFFIPPLGLNLNVKFDKKNKKNK